MMGQSQLGAVKATEVVKAKTPDGDSPEEVDVKHKVLLVDFQKSILEELRASEI